MEIDLAVAPRDAMVTVDGFGQRRLGLPMNLGHCLRDNGLRIWLCGQDLGLVIVVDFLWLSIGNWKPFFGIQVPGLLGVLGVFVIIL